MTIGDRIKQQRESLHISQTELAQKTNSSKQSIYKYENNIVTNIPSNKIELISNVLHCSPAYLMGWDTNTCNLSSFDTLTKTEKSIIIAYRNADNIGKECVLRTLNIKKAK